MALGGGTFVVQNKKLPGAYINFVSAASASATLSERGIATMPLELDWGVDGEIFEVTNGDFQKNSMKIFGYAYTDDHLKGLRDLFLNAKTLYAYRLNGGGVKAANDFATARYGGTRGNDLKIRIQANADDTSAFDVVTLLGTTIVDEQTVKKATDLKANEYVTFKTGATLKATAATPLTGGTNAAVDGSAHQKYLDKIESYTYNTMGVVTTEETIKTLYTSFCKRLRDEMGVKFQLCIYRKAADFMGTINVKNKALDDGANEASLIYWATGVSAGCAVNKSNQNKKYDGVLEDINSMVTVSDTCGDMFKDNQTVRVCDQIANDIAVIFNIRYMGTVPNDGAGRISLWKDIVKHHKDLQDIRALEDFSDTDITVAQGDSKKSVVVTDAVTVVNAMDKLYMTVTVA